MRCLPLFISAFCSAFPLSSGRPAGLPPAVLTEQTEHGTAATVQTAPLTADGAPQDTRLRYLTKNTDYTAFLLGSFPAYGYDAAVLESYLSAKTYHLAAENLSETEKMFDFAVEACQPTVLFFSVAACDFFSDNTVQSAFPVGRLADGSVFRGINDVMRIGDAALYENKYAYRFAAKQPTEGVPSSERVLTLHDKMRRVASKRTFALSRCFRRAMRRK